MVSRMYTWPGITKDVQAWVKACPQCQGKNQAHSETAPLQLLPVLMEPFEVMAFDLVGPFTRSKEGYTYLLISMCPATKYPDAIPLKDIRAVTVAEALQEIFSKSGFPKKLLTDQGKQFTGALMQELCKLLQIEKIQTSAYHPQTNGCLERWHGTLKLMEKTMEAKQDWARQV